jgi:hypothetical protein
MTSARSRCKGDRYGYRRESSYWNEYYRAQFWRREDYPAFSALMTLRQWLSRETTDLGQR